MASSIPINRASFTRDELVAATGGRCDPFTGAVSGVFTDSRGDLSGGLFVALPGERFDGHDFAAAAAGRGARVLLVERDVAVASGAALLRVPSTLEALGALGAFHRRRWGGRVAAVAGSVGKTTTRTAVYALARASGLAAYCPAGNLNNRVGVPLVLLALGAEHELAVVELGTSLPGEIERLTAISEPDVAVLTRIALEHSEGLGDLDAIEAEEGALLRGLKPEALALVNADDERCLRQLGGSPARRRVAYGLRAPADPALRHYRVTHRQDLPAGGSRLLLERPGAAPLDVQSPLLGEPGAYAIAAAVASVEGLLGRALEPAEVERASSSPSLGEPGRLAPKPLADGSLVLDDTYNASPASVRSSVAVARQLADLRGGRLLLVLGEMRELGALSAPAHREVGVDIAHARPDLLIAFGGDAALFLEEPRARGVAAELAADAAEALELVRARRAPNDVILVKASRSLRAERVVLGLLAGEAPPP